MCVCISQCAYTTVYHIHVHVLHWLLLYISVVVGCNGQNFNLLSILVLMVLGCHYVSSNSIRFGYKFCLRMYLVTLAWGCYILQGASKQKHYMLLHVILHVHVCIICMYDYLHVHVHFMDTLCNTCICIHSQYFYTLSVIALILSCVITLN